MRAGGGGEKWQGGGGVRGGGQERSEHLGLAGGSMEREDRGDDGKGVCEGKGQRRHQGNPHPGQAGAAWGWEERGRAKEVGRNDR